MLLYYQCERSEYLPWRSTEKSTPLLNIYSILLLCSSLYWLGYWWINTAQFDDSEPRKWANFTGTAWKDLEKAPKPAGKHRKSTEHGSSIRNRVSPHFFDDFRSVSMGQEQKVGQKSLKKIRRNSVWNTASMFRQRCANTSTTCTMIYRYTFDNKICTVVI